jgi:tetratricopeptide (TPR) repeat protein
MTHDQILEKISEAVSLKREGKFEDANEVYRKLDQDNPNYPVILKSWAKTLICLGKYSLAESYMLRAAIGYNKNGDDGNAWQCNDQLSTIQNRFDDPDDFKSYVRGVSAGLITNPKLD